MELKVAAEPVAPLTCDQAIDKYFPAGVKQQAINIRQAENGLGTADRISGINRHADGTTSRDYGCMQINDYWHFGTKGWTNFNDIYNAEFNVQYALKIYQGWGNTWCAWTTANKLGYCKK